MAVMGIFLACGQRDDPDEFVRREVAELQKRTIAPGSKVLVQFGPKQDGWSKSAKWGFETNWDWAHYGQWVTSQLRPDFGISHVDASHVVFVRSLRGDTEELGIEAESDGHKLRVTITLVVYPN